MKTYCLTVEFGGEVELEIKAKSKKQAKKIATEFGEGLVLSGDCFKNKAIIDASEMLNFNEVHEDSGDYF